MFITLADFDFRWVVWTRGNGGKKKMFAVQVHERFCIRLRVYYTTYNMMWHSVVLAVLILIVRVCIIVGALQFDRISNDIKCLVPSKQLHRPWLRDSDARLATQEVECSPRHGHFIFYTHTPAIPRGGPTVLPVRDTATKQYFLFYYPPW